MIRCPGAARAPSATLTAAILAAFAVTGAACDKNSGDDGAGSEGAPAAEAEAGDTAEQEPEIEAPTGPTGTIRGTVTLTGDAPEMPKLRRGVDAVCAKTEMRAETVVAGDGGELANVFVRVKDDSFEAPPPDEPAVVDQVECMYRPRVQGAVAGQKLEIRNSDSTMHNVHAREMEMGAASGSSTLFNQGQPASGPAIVKSAGGFDIAELSCDVHAWMKGYVIVSGHPYFATSGEDGSFVIDSVPVGTLTLETWHEHYGSKTTEVTVEEGETAEASLSYDAAADAPE